MRILAVFLTLLFLIPSGPLARAGDFVEDQPSSGSSENSDSTFDPFSDYSEFEENSEEESDVNFFHNGRFFSVGLLGGYETFTDVLGLLYQPNFAYGVFLTYFFDLRFGIQVAYLTADHSLSIIDAQSNKEYAGKISLSHFEFDVKYYLNTQNVTRGLGAINPYLLLGFGNYTRNTTINGASGFVRDVALGIQGGAGVEIPFARNSMFFGAQALYNYVSFPDRGAPITVNNVSTGINPSGDPITLLIFLGTNF